MRPVERAAVFIHGRAERIQGAVERLGVVAASAGVELSTLQVQLEGARHVAVNDAVVASATLGRMIELGHAIGREEIGTQPCDGLICATPSGSTAYNLSNGGPVLVWGLDAMVLT